MPLYIILMAILLYVFTTNVESSGVPPCGKNDVKAIVASLELFRLDTLRYPTSIEGLDVLVDTKGISGARKGGYLSKIPTDIWGNPFQYRTPNTSNGPYDVFSLGRDGKLGGTGLDDDYGSIDAGYFECLKAVKKKRRINWYKRNVTYVLFPVLLMCIVLFVTVSTIRRLVGTQFPVCCGGRSVYISLALFFPLLLFLYLFSRPP